MIPGEGEAVEWLWEAFLIEGWDLMVAMTLRSFL
jgi:hypothetical protein